MCSRNFVFSVAEAKCPVVASLACALCYLRDPLVARVEWTAARQEPSVANQEPSVARQKASVAKQEPSVDGQ